MKVFTYSEARQNLSKLLQLAKKEEIEILRKDGSVFYLRAKNKKRKSPFDISGIKTKATTQDILDAVRESRMGEQTQPTPKSGAADGRRWAGRGIRI